MHIAVKRSAALFLALALLIAVPQLGVFAADKTGVGMAEWALRAYDEGWKYVYGGSEVGSIDCSGLIRSYIKGGGGAKALLDAASKKGNISSMPKVHGLGLWCDGHSGVYVGKNESGENMAVDARNSRVNVVYSAMNSRTYSPWVKWFKISGVSYPTTGWQTFNGKQYYYNNGEFVTGIFTVDGVTYDFGKSGALKGEADLRTTTTAAKTTTTKKTTTTTVKRTTATTVKKTTTTSAISTTTARTVSLKLGMSGDDVAKLQKRLIELGYLKSEATGYFGEQTYDAVRSFQRAAGLAADGRAGEKTLIKLYSDSAPAKTTTTKTTTTTTTATTTASIATTAATTAKPGKSTSTKPTETTAQTNAETTAEAEAETEPTTTTTLSPEEEAMLQYETLDFGATGYSVEELLLRLAELEYYEHDISDYYGVFARLAVMSFQLDNGLEPTGIADPLTQLTVFAEDAAHCGETSSADSSLMYGNDDLQSDDGDYYDENTVSSSDVETVVIPSDGLDSFGTKADISSFIGQYGSSGALQTLGIFEYSEPVVTIYRGGEAFVISDELSNAIDNCVFF